MRVDPDVIYVAVRAAPRAETGARVHLDCARPLGALVVWGMPEVVVSHLSSRGWNRTFTGGTHQWVPKAPVIVHGGLTLHLANFSDAPGEARITWARRNGAMSVYVARGPADAQ